ncbi:MAG: hypothetical protein ABI454_05540 [Sphingomicrobium sp.]
MMFLRLLNVQGIAGIAVSLALAILLVIQKGETRHWRKESGRHEELYRDSEAALAGTIANYRAAAEQARAADQANADRVHAQQAKINEERSDEFEARLSAARAAADRLRSQARQAAADPRGGPNAPVPGLSAAPGQPHQAAGEDGFSLGAKELDWRLTATEQAIQLDELIQWVKAQAKVDNNAAVASSPESARH